MFVIRQLFNLNILPFLFSSFSSSLSCPLFFNSFHWQWMVCNSEHPAACQRLSVCLSFFSFLSSLFLLWGFIGKQKAREARGFSLNGVSICFSFLPYASFHSSHSAQRERHSGKGSDAVFAGTNQRAHRRRIAEAKSTTDWAQCPGWSADCRRVQSLGKGGKTIIAIISSSSFSSTFKSIIVKFKTGKQQPKSTADWHRQVEPRVDCNWAPLQRRTEFIDSGGSFTGGTENFP